MNFFRKNTNRHAEASQPVSAPIPFSTSPADTGVHFESSSPMSRNLSIGIAPTPRSHPISSRLSMPVSMPASTPMSTPVSRHDDSEDMEGKTRLVGFDTSDGRTELFGDDAKVDGGGVCFRPVGFLLIVDGPGEGYAFALQTGMSTIGRSPDETVPLDFGDRAISRSSHAAIVYDPQSHQFLLGHGGKANIVRLNGAPVVMTEPIENGALIQIGETTMRFVALCDEEFNWNDDAPESDDDAFI